MNQFEKYTIVYKESAENTAKDLAKHIEAYVNNSTVGIMPIHTIDIPLLNKSDLVITLGGDGTFVESANRIEDTYILGINANPDTSEGALTSIDVEEIGELDKILDGNYNVKTRQRADVIRNGVILPERSTNETYVGAKSRFHASRYILKYKNCAEEQRSSGVIVSSGTGSKAWFKSAGGKEFGSGEEKLSFIVSEPYYGKRIYCPSTFGGEILSDEKIEIESTRDFGGILAIGFKTYEFNRGDIVQIKLSDKPLKVLERLTK
jgi:hypothetical protein